MANKKRSIDEVLTDDERKERLARSRDYRESNKKRSRCLDVGKTELTNGTKDTPKPPEKTEHTMLKPFQAPKPLSWTVSLSLQQSTNLSPDDFIACFELLKTTSKSDYAASSRGWDPNGKQSEMKHPEMQYILIRREELPVKDGQRTQPAIETSALSEDTKNSSAPPTNPSIVAVGPSFTSTSPTQPLKTDNTTNGQNEVVSDRSPSAAPILGFLSFMFEKDDPPNEHRPVLYVYEIHLAEELRGAGLGSYLLTVAERLCSEAGLEKVMLTVFTRNRKASNFYRKMGYYIDEECSPRSREVRGRKIPPDYRIRCKWIDGVGKSNGADVSHPPDSSEDL